METGSPEGGGGDRGRPVAAWLVLATCAALVAATVTCWVLARPGWSADQLFYVVDTTDAVIYGVVAWFVLARRARPAVWIIGLTAVGGGFSAFSAQWQYLVARYPDLPNPPPLTTAGGWAWMPGTFAVIVVLPWLMREGRLPRYARAAVALGLLIDAALLALAWTAPYGPLEIDDPNWATWIDRLFPWLISAVVVLGLVAAADAGRRWRTGPPAQRTGLGWLAIGTALLALSFVPLTLPPAWQDALPWQITPLTHLASQAFFPAAVLVVVLRQRLWGVDLAVRRTLVWFLLTALVVAAYALGVSLLSRLVPGTVLPGVLAGAVIAAGVQPALAWLRLRVDHLVHGEGAEPLRVVRTVGQRLREADDLLEGVTSSLTTSLRLAAAAIEVDDPDDPFVARAGEPGDGGEALAVPLVSGQRQLGRLVAWPYPGERLDGRTRTALTDLAPVVTAAAGLAATTRALAASRARLAEARDSERRTLRRDLHDGLGPALAGVGLGLRAARNLITADIAAAAELLDRLGDEVDQRVEEVRDLARNLLPPVLDEGGLRSALDRLVERYTEDFPLEVRGDPGPVPPRVATAVYGVVTEAVRNAYRHAGGTTCVVTLERSGGRLSVTVHDDGRGVPGDATPGVGMRSMRERAEGVGGTLDVGPGDPGTRVRLVVPVEEER